MKIIKCLAVIIMLLGGVMFTNDKIFSKEQSKRTKKILLLGASVGQAWKLEEWPQRMKNQNYIFESIAVYDFDKSDALKEILMRPKRIFRFNRTYLRGFFSPSLQKPDIIIIKECSGYFPGNQPKYESLIKKWITQCKETGIIPIIAIVVPITEELANRVPGKLEAIIKYNDWVKKYTRETGIECFDLETPLRISETNRALRPDLTIGDGSHLNKKAYDILDKMLTEFLARLFS